MAEKVCSLVTSTPLIEPHRFCHQRDQALPLSSKYLPAGRTGHHSTPMYSHKLADDTELTVKCVHLCLWSTSPSPYCL